MFGPKAVIVVALAASAAPALALPFSLVDFPHDPTFLHEIQTREPFRVGPEIGVPLVNGHLLRDEHASHRHGGKHRRKHGLKNGHKVARDTTQPEGDSNPLFQPCNLDAFARDVDKSGSLQLPRKLCTPPGFNGIYRRDASDASGALETNWEDIFRNLDNRPSISTREDIGKLARDGPFGIVNWDGARQTSGSRVPIAWKDIARRDAPSGALNWDGILPSSGSHPTFSHPIGWEGISRREVLEMLARSVPADASGTFKQQVTDCFKDAASRL